MSSASGKTTSTELQNNVTDVFTRGIGKNLEKLELCKFLANEMNIARGKPWNCITGDFSSKIWTEHGEAALFKHDGSKFLLFKGKQSVMLYSNSIFESKSFFYRNIKQEKFHEVVNKNKLLREELSAAKNVIARTRKELIEANNVITGTRKELTETKNILAKKEKEHEEYVKKMAETKAIIEKMLQMKHERKNNSV